MIPIVTPSPARASGRHLRLVIMIAQRSAWAGTCQVSFAHRELLHLIVALVRQPRVRLYSRFFAIFPILPPKASVVDMC